MAFAVFWLLLYQSYEGILEELSAESCSPRSVHLAAPPQSASRSSEQFYEMAQQLGDLQAPVLHGRHRKLCDEQLGRKREWEYCLPISGRMDLPFCELPDRVDVLSRQRSSLCYGSVLHMLLIDVYEVFQERGVKPALLYGTMLGAFRNGSTIPFTEDADLGYQPDKSTIQELRDALWIRGYHMFHYGIGRICIAPTHPLASLLYDPRKRITTEYSVPYVDLYMMIPVGGSQWRVQLTKDKRFIPHAKFEPYSQLQLNNVTYDTLADPVDFLVHEYGDDYMVPKRTLNWFWTIVSYVWPL
uniref:LicD family protein n=1 Tax=Globisporangium ultimum (strain ATCC 200006 / CBS 805.95 / DAOM BR144) TaxID=431595 RepID=K3XBF8_GLOUD